MAELGYGYMTRGGVPNVSTSNLGAHKTAKDRLSLLYGLGDPSWEHFSQQKDPNAVSNHPLFAGSGQGYGELTRGADGLWTRGGNWRDVAGGTSSVPSIAETPGGFSAWNARYGYGNNAASPSAGPPPSPRPGAAPPVPGGSFPPAGPRPGAAPPVTPGGGQPGMGGGYRGQPPGPPQQGPGGGYRADTGIVGGPGGGTPGVSPFGSPGPSGRPGGGLFGDSGGSMQPGTVAGGGDFMGRPGGGTPAPSPRPGGAPPATGGIPPAAGGRQAFGRTGPGDTGGGPAPTPTPSPTGITGNYQNPDYAKQMQPGGDQNYWTDKGAVYDVNARSGGVGAGAWKAQPGAGGYPMLGKDLGGNPAADPNWVRPGGGGGAAGGGTVAGGGDFLGRGTQPPGPSQEQQQMMQQQQEMMRRRQLMQQGGGSGGYHPLFGG